MKKKKNSKNVYGKSKNSRKKKNRNNNIPILPDDVQVGVTVGIPTMKEIMETFKANTDVKHIIVEDENGGAFVYENPFYQE